MRYKSIFLVRLRWFNGKKKTAEKKNNDEKISTSSHRMASIVSDLKNGEGKKNKVLDKKSSIHYGHWTLFVVQRM